VYNSPMSSNGVLDKLLGGPARVKILRLFILNPDSNFESKIIAQKTKVKGHSLRRELGALRSVRFIKKAGKGYRLSRSFEFLIPLRNLLLSTEPFKGNEIVSRFKNGGKIKLVVASGVFTQSPDGRVDLLLVGDRLKRNKIENALKNMESEVGKELSYAIFETPEFKYRMEVYDKFVRDVFDYPHRVLLDKIGVV